MSYSLTGKSQSIRLHLDDIHKRTSSKDEAYFVLTNSGEGAWCPDRERQGAD